MDQIKPIPECKNVSLHIQLWVQTGLSFIFKYNIGEFGLQYFMSDCSRLFG